MKLQVAIAGEVYEVEVDDLDEDSVDDGGTAIQSVVLPAPGSGSMDAGGKSYFSPVAGIVTRVHVECGQEVNENDVLLVLEAMKMETNIIATTSGKLKSIHVMQGEAVRIRQVLLEFE